MKLEELCEREGIVLAGEDQHPWHCMQHMRTSGFITTDACECEVCGLEIVDLSSPFINGAYRRGSSVMLEGDDRRDLWINPENADEADLQSVGLTKDRAQAA